MSLTEIENEMRKRGFNKNKAYLSNLQNGKMDPPSFDVTHVLCDVIGGDPVRLALTGVIMKISQQEFFPVWTDTIATMLATFLDINKDKWSWMISEIFSMQGFELSKEKVEEIFDYALLKQMVNEAIEEIPYKEIVESVIEQEMGGKEVFTEVLMDTTGDQSEVLEELTQDEAEYLNECLAVYRKLNLKPLKEKED
ncbi:hypothetical protein [Bacillus toyonensis]|uniref:Uncharacterized protein n=2 Tax=Bacillus toyonensis TaxID=155322 RepID=A0A2C4QH57_9BACI|nr:hypothetical protein [Bacillus toyonensis]PGA98736.1 hypothetical protein COL93_21145 [Bacillus toyonensis]PHD64159.1 hypothetical protein COF40_24850 [Bacillus toyonensis]